MASEWRSPAAERAKNPDKAGSSLPALSFLPTSRGIMLRLQCTLVLRRRMKSVVHREE